MDAPAAHSGADDEDDDDQSDDMGAELRLVPADAELGVYSLRWGGQRCVHVHVPPCRQY